jgi:hypothetical protein
MGIHKAGQDDSTGAVDFGQAPRVFLDPGILESLARFPHGNNLAGNAKHSRVSDDAQFAECAAAARAGSSRHTHGKELANVEEHQSRLLIVLFSPFPQGTSGFFNNRRL